MIMFIRAVVLELTHLVHSRNNLLLLVIHCLRLLVFLFVYYLNSSYIGAITLIVLELDVIVQQKVHKTRLLIRRQLVEHKGLWLISWRRLER